MPKSATCPSSFSLTREPPLTVNAALRCFGLRIASALLGLSCCDQLYRQLEHDGSLTDFVRQALATLNISYAVDAQACSRIPVSGPCVVISNHPYGGLDGLILLDLIGRARSDVMVMGNHLLGRIPELRPHLIAVDPFGGASAARMNISPLRQAFRCLEQGQLLVIFPAGEVSYRQSRTAGVVDPPWSPTLGKIVRRSQAPVLPIFFPGHNGPLFQLAGNIQPRLRTALLPRMLLSQRGSHQQPVIGQPIGFRSLREVACDRQLTDYLRLRTYALGLKKADRTTPSTRLLPHSKPLIKASGKVLLRHELDRLPADQLLVDHGDFQVFCASAGQMHWLYHEIGRLREMTFRQAGEGTGRSCDLDSFDRHYSHLFLWHKQKQEIAGAYRIGQVDRILSAKGVTGLYTSTLFDLKPALLEYLQPALELGRSFVRPEYQRSYAPLLGLWKGIGHYLTRHPHYRYLIGPVSISREYSNASRQLMTSVLTRHFQIRELARLVVPRTPVSLKPLPLDGLDLELLKDMDVVSALVADLEDDGKGVPVLLRHYINLGGKILSFNRDPAFSDVIDGLLVIDLLKTDKKQLQRYMGTDGYRGYMARHQNKLSCCA